MPIKILYEDDCYIAFDKPSGLLVIPTPQQERHTLTHIVNETFWDKKNPGRLYPCHRLDRETSGVILYAKGKKHQQLMMAEFFQRRVKKKYIAFLNGHIKPSQGEMRSRIKDIDQRKFKRHTPPLLAITRYRVTQYRKRFCVVEAYPLTGRTNQIRIQCSEGGFPILGDRKYAIARNFLLKFKRTALHASELRFAHPVYHRETRIMSPLPQDMEDFLNQHR